MRRDVLLVAELCFFRRLLKPDRELRDLVLSICDLRLRFASPVRVGIVNRPVPSVRPPACGDLLLLRCVHHLLFLDDVGAQLRKLFGVLVRGRGSFFVQLGNSCTQFARFLFEVGDRVPSMLFVLIELLLKLLAKLFLRRGSRLELFLMLNTQFDLVFGQLPRQF